MTTRTLHYDVLPPRGAARDRQASARRDLLLAPPAILRNPSPAAAGRPSPGNLGAYALLATAVLVLAAALLAASVLPTPVPGLDFLAP